MPFHISFQFQQQTSKLGGWTENFWMNTTDLTFATAKATALGQLLDATKGQQVIATGMRISDVSAFRSVENVPLSFGQEGLTDANDADYPSTALRLKSKAPGGYTVRQWFRGIPDQNISNSGRYVPRGAYVIKINRVITALTSTANLWALRVLDKTIPKKIISNLVLTTGVVTCKAHGYGPAGTVVEVRISGFREPKQANDVWNITVIDADSFSLNFWVQPNNLVMTAKKPTSRLQVYTFIQTSTAAIDAATSHYTGRPQGLLGGRRKTR